MLGIEALEGVLAMPEAIDLIERTLAHEASGGTSVSPKFITPFDHGAMRVLFAADRAAGYAAMKAYHSIDGVGTRYVVLLYRLKDGELVAVLDGRLITDLRTGAVSGVAARRVPIRGAVTVGVVGSGNQARTQLESLASVYDIASAAVYSPTAANREAFARDMGAKLGFPITPAGSVEAAVHDRPVVVTASNARSDEPLLRGAWITRCRLLCAVGNTRRQFAELDVACLQRARLVIVDSAHAVEEAGELVAAVAAGALPEAKRATLAQIVTGAATVPEEGLVVFKSVGMALQDLALAVRYHELLADRPGTVIGPNVASLRAKQQRASR